MSAVFPAEIEMHSRGTPRHQDGGWWYLYCKWKCWKRGSPRPWFQTTNEDKMKLAENYNLNICEFLRDFNYTSKTLETLRKNTQSIKWWRISRGLQNRQTTRFFLFTLPHLRTQELSKQLTHRDTIWHPSEPIWWGKGSSMQGTSPKLL